MKCYVLQVLTGQEIEIREQLRELGIEVHVPQEERTIRSGGKWISRVYTLFTSYVFVMLNDVKVDYYTIKKLSGVIRFLELHSGGAGTLTEQETDYILKICEGDEPVNASNVTRKDNLVVPLDGPLKGYSDMGIPIKYDFHQRRAYLNLSLFGVEKEITLSFHLVLKSSITAGG
jgi:transcription antitermination factor NusG